MDNNYGFQIFYLFGFQYNTIFYPLLYTNLHASSTQEAIEKELEDALASVKTEQEDKVKVTVSCIVHTHDSSPFDDGVCVCMYA